MTTAGAIAIIIALVFAIVTLKIIVPREIAAWRKLAHDAITTAEQMYAQYNDLQSLARAQQDTLTAMQRALTDANQQLAQLKRTTPAHGASAATRENNWRIN